MNPGDALANWRLEQRLSQEEAASKIEVAQGTWGAWEAGLKQPGLKNALALDKLTNGIIAATMWPGSPRRRKLRRVERLPVVPKEAKSA